MHGVWKSVVILFVGGLSVSAYLLVRGGLGVPDDDSFARATTSSSSRIGPTISRAPEVAPGIADSPTKVLLPANQKIEGSGSTDSDLAALETTAGGHANTDPRQSVEVRMRQMYSAVDFSRPDSVDRVYAILTELLPTKDATVMAAIADFIKRTPGDPNALAWQLLACEADPNYGACGIENWRASKYCQTRCSKEALRHSHLESSPGSYEIAEREATTLRALLHGNRFDEMAAAICMATEYSIARCGMSLKDQLAH